MRDILDRLPWTHSQDDGSYPYSDEELQAIAAYRAGGGDPEGQRAMIRDMRAGRDPMDRYKIDEPVADYGTTERNKQINRHIHAMDFLRSIAGDDIVEDAEPAADPKFYLREMETKDGTWVWQFGMTAVNGTKVFKDGVSWTGRWYKTAKLATLAARKHQNVRTASGSTRDFYANPVIAPKVPYGPGSPFYEG